MSMEHKAQAMLQELAMQRDTFCDRCVTLAGELALHKLIIKELESKLDKKEEERKHDE